MSEKNQDSPVPEEMPVQNSAQLETLAQLPAALPSKTAGQMLREARESQGLAIAALAANMKVPAKKIEALEADRLEELTDAVFARALASGVCRSLKIDPVPVLAILPQLSTRVLDQVESGMNVTYRDPKDGPPVSPLHHITWPVAMGVLALMLAAFAVISLPELSVKGRSSGGLTPSLIVEPAPVVALPNPVSPAPSPDMPAAVSTATASASVPTAQTGSAEPVSPVAGTSPAPSAPASPLSISDPIGPSAAPVDSVVLITSEGESWVEIRDVRGRTVLQKILRRGETVGAGPSMGSMPFSVVVGRASESRVSVRGQALDLSAVSSKDGVARFDVK